MRFIFFILLAFSISAQGTESNPLNFDHNHPEFSSLLSNYTQQKDGQTWVDYTGLNSKGRSQLQAYLRNLEAVSMEQYQGFSEDQRLAFLINAYNAFTIEWILIHYPVKSIKDTGSFFSSAWKKTFPGYKLLGKKFNLDNIEHDRIRVEFKEPRIHYAVNCASIGCPSLRSKAYTGENIKAELSQAEESFFKNPGKFIVKNKVAHVSSILDWYGGDFANVFGSLESYIIERSKFYQVAGDLPQKNIKIDFLSYSWKLNGK